MGYIYSITNKINERVYVGQAENFGKRKKRHLGKLIDQIHENTELQKDFNKFGEEEFEFKLLLTCENSELDDLERFYIKKLKAFEDDGGYNATTGGKINFVYSKGYQTRHKEAMNNASGKISDTLKEFWTVEQKEKHGKKMSTRYSDPEERRKTAEATKAGMAKLPKEKLSRRHLNPHDNELLLEIIRDIQNPETKTTQQSLVEKYNIPIALSKRLKNGKHPIYQDIEEGVYTL